MPLNTQGMLPVEALPVIRRNAAQLKLNLQSTVARLASNSVTVQDASEIYMMILRSVEQLGTLKTVTGLNDFATAQYAEPTDTVAAIEAIEAKAAEIVGFFVANAPASISSLPFEEWSGGNFLNALYAPDSTESVALRALMGELAALVD